MSDTSKPTLGIAVVLINLYHGNTLLCTNHCLLPNNGCTHHFNNNNCGEGGFLEQASIAQVGSTGCFTITLTTHTQTHIGQGNRHGCEKDSLTIVIE